MSDRLVFCTDAWPERDRFAIWREEILSRFPLCDITTQDQASFRASIELQRVGAIDISRHLTSAAEFTRTRDLLGDGDDTLMVALFERGAARQRQQREEYQTFAAGDAFILDTTHCYSALVRSDSQFWILKVPRRKIAALPACLRCASLRCRRHATYVASRLDARGRR
jgi:hypothetical protein